MQGDKILPCRRQKVLIKPIQDRNAEVVSGFERAQNRIQQRSHPLPLRFKKKCRPALIVELACDQKLLFGRHTGRKELQQDAQRIYGWFHMLYQNPIQFYRKNEAGSQAFGQQTGEIIVLPE